LDSSDILCTICARGGSKGVKNKNIKLINGRPLISYTIEVAKASGLFKHIVISTDSPEIAETAKYYGAEAFFLRPAELATDSAAKLPVIRHALTESERHYGKSFSTLMDLDATSPLRTVQDLHGALEVFMKGGYDNVITAMPSKKSPYFNLVEVSGDGKVFLSKRLAKTVVRRQDAPKCYDMNASIYLWTRDALLNNETIISGNTGLFVMPEERSIDIDTDLDFEFVEFLMKKEANNVGT